MQPDQWIKVLGAILPGDALERLADEVDDPGAGLDSGNRVLVGQALKEIGDHFIESVKADYAGISQAAIASPAGDIIVKSRPANEYFSIDAMMVKRIFPREERPDLYKRVQTKGSVSLELPRGLK